MEIKDMEIIIKIIILKIDCHMKEKVRRILVLGIAVLSNFRLIILKMMGIKIKTFWWDTMSSFGIREAT